MSLALQKHKVSSQARQGEKKHERESFLKIIAGRDQNWQFSSKTIKYWYTLTSRLLNRTNNRLCTVFDTESPQCSDNITLDASFCFVYELIGKRPNISDERGRTFLHLIINMFAAYLRPFDHPFNKEIKHAWLESAIDIALQHVANSKDFYRRTALQHNYDQNISWV